MRKINIYEGETLSLEMLKPQFGNFPIARYEGIVAKIEFIKPEPGKPKPYFPVGSTWDCEVIEVLEKCIIIRPLRMTSTASANDFELTKRINQLREANNKKHPETRTALLRSNSKIKKNNPYLSKVELEKTNA